MESQLLQMELFSHSGAVFACLSACQSHWFKLGAICGNGNTSVKMGKFESRQFMQFGIETLPAAGWDWIMNTRGFQGAPALLTAFCFPHHICYRHVL